MKLFDSIEPNIQEWAMKQQVFFSASAPINGKHINVSPKGLPSSSFSILSPKLCAYVDATGSGVETIANIYENGRVTIMFCSFETVPRILRFFCTGRVVEWDTPDFNGWIEKMGNHKVVAARAVIVLDVFQVQTSCGYAVPYLTLRADEKDPSKQRPFLEDRQTLGHWGSKQIEGGLMDGYRAEKNSRSLDGLPGLRRARRDAGERLWLSGIQPQRVSGIGMINLAITAILSALLTVISMYMLGLTRMT